MAQILMKWRLYNMEEVQNKLFDDYEALTKWENEERIEERRNVV